MKKFSVLILFICLMQGVSAQKLKNTKNTMLDINTYIYSGILDKFDDYEPETKREKELLERNEKYLESKVELTALNTFYAQFDSVGLPIEDKDALIDFVNYSANGLPNPLIPKATIKKIVKKGYESDYYLIFKINIRYEERSKGILNAVRVVNPEVEARIRIFTPERKLYREVKYALSMTEDMKSSDFPGLRFDKLDRAYIDYFYNKIEPILIEVVEKTVDLLARQ